MSTLVTAASGQLGQLVLSGLLAKGVNPKTIVAGARSVDKLSAFAALGVEVRDLDYENPDTFEAAFEGVTKMLLISGSDIGKRLPQHTAVANAAKARGVEHIVYTSAPRADNTTLQLATEHTATESVIRETGVPFTFLRNNWYFENYLPQIPAYLASGAIFGAAGDGKVSGAARADYAAAAVAVLTESGHEGVTYELGGDSAFTMADLAEAISDATGTPVVYKDVSIEELQGILESTGMPQPVAAVIADIDRSIEAGELFASSGDLARLIGRPTTSLLDAVKAAIN